MRLSRLATLAIVAAHLPVLHAQSTQATVLGLVKDSAGAAIPGATVTLTGTDTGVRRTVTSDGSGNYQLLNVSPGHYALTVTATGFTTEATKDLTLTARQELRRDATLTPGAVNQEVTVDAANAGTIDTDSSSIDATLNANEVLSLPANYRASVTGTSPLTLIQTLPGVQTDESGNYSVQGGLPFQTEVSVDGITSQNTTSNSPLPDAFPSADSIAELRVDGVLNNAEFGQPGEVTTITKSGTNALHGAVFYYHQDSSLQARAFGATSKAKLVTNDFGASLNGPVFIPHLYHGQNRTFFLGTFEGYRSPRTSLYQAVVPTAEMKAGNFTNAGVTALTNPYTGGRYPLNAVPINAVSQKFLQFFPDPNYMGPNGTTPLNVFTGATNYSTNKDTSLSSNQFDVRGDQYFGQKALIFARFTWKNQNPNAYQPLAVPSSVNSTQDRILVVAGNYNFTAHLVNEFRYGFTFDTAGNTNPFDGKAFAQASGLQGLQNLFYNGIPELDFSTLTSLNADRLTSTTKSRTHVFTDNLSWVRGNHNFKFGVDIRRIEALTPLGFNGADNYGTFDFSSATFTGNEFADFLIGAPSNTFYDVVQSDNDGKTLHYHAYAQDQWKATPRLTLNYGIRYEFHPAYHDPTGNIGNFDPSVAKSGRVVYPKGYGNLVSAAFLKSFNSCGLGQASGVAAQNGAPCTPTLDNEQAGLPSGLRTSIKTRFAPRFGFAYRPSANNRTVITGGYGLYNITLLGRNFYSLTGTLQADTTFYGNVQTATGPAYTFPQLFAGAGGSVDAVNYGQAYFGTANDVHWKDPYSQQISLSVEHDLGKGYGFRASYIGMVTRHLVWAPNLNDLPYSTTVSAANQPLSARPFPNWGRINTRSTGATANYQSAQVAFNHRLTQGLTFDSTYTLAKNLTNNQGPGSSSFASENGGSRASYAATPDVDFGQAYGTRRHRWNSTVAYALPIGRGRQFGSSMNRLADAAIGGWQLSNIFVLQSGPFLSPYFPSGQGDPSGTGSGLNTAANGASLGGRQQKPDLAPGQALLATRPTAGQWFNTAAYTCPGTPNYIPGTACTTGRGRAATATTAADPLPIGRFGNLQNGAVVGPKNVVLSTGLSKSFAITERVSFRAEGTFTNILNHTNLGNPGLNISAPGSFGVITSSNTGDFAGPRTGQISGRLQF